MIRIVAFLLVLAIVPRELAWQAAAFVAFRFFDIAKPPPIRYCERRYGGGFGVMFELPIFILALVRLQILTVDQLRRNRRMAWFIGILVAVAMPTVDAISVFQSPRPRATQYVSGRDRKYGTRIPGHISWPAAVVPPQWP